MSKLKTLEQYNSESFKNHFFDFGKPQKNGIACPKCGEELYDTQPNTTLTSNPPQKNIGCLSENCDYVGYRIA